MPLTKFPTTTAPSPGPRGVWVGGEGTTLYCSPVACVYSGLGPGALAQGGGASPEASSILRLNSRVGLAERINNGPYDLSMDIMYATLYNTSEV